MSAKDYPSVAFVKQLFRYEDGKLFWLERPREHFSRDRDWKTFNTAHAGKEAGTCNNPNDDVGRRWRVHVSTNRGHVSIYRYTIVWAMFHGKWPKEIDHRDRDSLNDRIENLRLCTRPQNNANSGLKSSNTSGAKGVIWHKKNKIWYVQIRVNGKQVHLGCFDSIEDARHAYAEAAQKQWGDFASKD